MSCPGCSAEQEEREEDDGQPRGCPDCGGVRVDGSELNRMLLHHNLPGIESLGGRKIPDGATAVCRKCRVDMALFEGGSRSEPQHYEICEDCGCAFVARDSLSGETPDNPEKELIAFFRKFANKKIRPSS